MKKKSKELKFTDRRIMKKDWRLKAKENDWPRWKEKKVSHCGGWKKARRRKESTPAATWLENGGVV